VVEDLVDDGEEVVRGEDGARWRGAGRSHRPARGGDEEGSLDGRFADTAPVKFTCELVVVLAGEDSDPVIALTGRSWRIRNRSPDHGSHPSSTGQSLRPLMSAEQRLQKKKT
jgi:hypothetical protein